MRKDSFTKQHLANAPRVLAMFALFAGSAGQAYAVNPAPADAGQILQEIEKGVEIKPLPAQPKVEEIAPVQEEEGQKVVINQFKFEGNHLIAEAELRAALASLTGREIGINELKTSAGLIAALYKTKGFLASVDLPDQDITEGVVTVQILEVALGKIKLDGEYGKDYKRVRPQVIQKAIDGDKVQGRAFEQEGINKALDRVGSLAGIKITSSMIAGEKEGTVDLSVKVQDQPLLSTYAALDNAGGRQTGRVKGLAYLTLASPLGYGETVNITGLKSQGTEYGKLGFMVPVGFNGVQIGANASYMEYEVIAREFQSQNIRGRSSVLGLAAQMPIFKTAKSRLGISLEADKKYFVNKNGSTTESDYDLNVYSVTLNGDYSDSFLAGGFNTATLDLGVGSVNLDGSLNKATDSANAHTQGGFKRLRWSLSRNQFLTENVSFMLSGSGQFAKDNLDSSEKFYLGGTSGVRAYPTSEGGGSEGYLLSAELRRYLPHNLTVSTFVDYGFVRQYEDNQKHNGGGILSDINTYHLSGYGASLNWQGPYNTNLKAIYAHRFGNNPNPTATGNDQDGSHVVDVFWLSGSVSF